MLPQPPADARLDPPGPPQAPRVPSARDLHGVIDVDNYAWMRDHAAPALRDYLVAERAYYNAHSQRLAGLAGELYQEATGRTADRSEDSVGWNLKGFVYRTRTLEGRENLQFLRSQSGESSDLVLLDENIIAAQTGFLDVGVREPSPDSALLAWSADVTGAEIYALRIRDLATGADLPEVIERSYPGSAWSADSRQLFYLVPDQLNRPCQVWRHRLGTDPAADVLVLEEPDARFELTLRTSRSGEQIVITSASRDTTEVALIPAAEPDAGPVVVWPRRRGVEYRVDHAADPAGGPGWLYIVTDDGAPEFTLLRAPAPGGAAEPVPCATVAPHDEGTRLVACDVLASHLLLTLRRNGSPLLAITDHHGGSVREIWPAMPAGSIAVEHAEEYHAGSVIIMEESLVEPPAWSELDLATGQRTLLKRREVPGYDPASYRTERRLAVAPDGAAIPVTLAFREGTPLDGSAPCLLYGYGAYESCEDPAFDVSLPSLLDRGVVYAIAHIRGGGENGRAWWQQGRLRAKPTTFSDFIAVADWLAGDVAGSPALVDGTRIVSRGLSAGGLLQGAVYSRAPGRWKAVIAEVPFVDCVTTMLDPGIPLTINEWDEWGDPRDPGDFACLRSYSPYDNPPGGPRPDLLVTGAVHDPRVLVHEPAKWVARLRETDTAGSRILFRVELGAGAHTGPSGRFGHLRYEAEVHAFALDAMGLAG
ncbi:MAG TPA: prolyl oligopeptidase family serine peptidase [Streptosporangiaceae bacterium]|nr:prolyl oligopeptidase family serine peptidase [Streptosporangiaceae bacterium]